MCLHASWMPKERCTRCTPLPKVEDPGRHPQRYGSRDITPTKEELAWFWSHVTRQGSHLVFNGLGKHHVNVHVTVDGRTYRTFISITRFAWVLFHPEIPFGCGDRVVNTCGNPGLQDSGDGCCVDHLTLIRGNS